MITQPLPHKEAQSTRPASEYILQPLREQIQLHIIPETSRASVTHAPNNTLACLQLLLGYEWLLAGADKLLLGTFPAQLSGLLNTSLSGGRLPGFFAATLRELVVPNATFFGSLIEWAELLAGLGLMSAGLLTLLNPLAGRFLAGPTATLFVATHRLLVRLAPLAAGGAALLGLSFFFLDGMPVPWFVASIAYGGSIDTGLFLAGISVILLVSQFTRRHQNR